MRRVCAIIPVLDEMLTIADVVRGARAHCDEVIVVDDGSRDDSGRCAAKAGALVVRHKRRHGKGDALRTGAKRALQLRTPDGERRFDALLFLDGDGQHETEQIPRFLESFERGSCLVVGDRSREFTLMSRSRRLTNLAMTCVLRRLFLPSGCTPHDSQCGFRLISVDTWRALSPTCSHFDFESEMLVQACRLGFRPSAVPVSVRPRRGRSKIRPVRDTWRFLRLIARLSRSGGRNGDVVLSMGDAHG